MNLKSVKIIDYEKGFLKFNADDCNEVIKLKNSDWKETNSPSKRQKKNSEKTSLCFGLHFLLINFIIETKFMISRCLCYVKPGPWEGLKIWGCKNCRTTSMQTWTILDIFVMTYIFVILACFHLTHFFAVEETCGLPKVANFHQLNFSSPKKFVKYRLFFLRSIAQFFTKIYINCFDGS